MKTLRSILLALLSVAFAIDLRAQMLTAPGTSAGAMSAANNNNTYLTLGSWATSGGADYRLGIDAGTMWFGAWENYRWYRTTNGALDMTLKQGSLGIGTANPDTKLTTFIGSPSSNLAGSNDSIRMQIYGLDHSASNNIVWGQDSSSLTLARFGVTWNSAADQMNFVWKDMYTGGVNSGELMRLTAGGNLGLGTASPTARLTTYVGTGAIAGTNDAIRLQAHSYSAGALNSIVWGQDTLGADLARFGVTWNASTGQMNFVWRDMYSSGVGTSELMRLTGGGNLGIGTANPSEKLAVNGKIRAKEVIVDTGWSDYVFADDYHLAPLAEIEAHIKAKRHLPGIPSAAEVEAGGVSLGEMQSKLLAKVEELTLHLIAQEKRFAGLEQENAALREENTRVQARLGDLERR